jgi:hypothetical protein
MWKILVPVDGSDRSARAVQHVIKLRALVAPLDVHLLNVQVPPTSTGEDAPERSITRQARELRNVRSYAAGARGRSRDARPALITLPTQKITNEISGPDTSRDVASAVHVEGHARHGRAGWRQKK